jgi:hypothetical protein
MTVQTINQQTNSMMDFRNISPLKSVYASENTRVSDTEIYNYLINEKKLDRNKSLGILANIKGESDFKIGVTEKGDAKNKGIGLFQLTFPTRKSGLLKNVPDYKTNWKGQIDYFLSESEANSYLERNFDTGEEAAEFLMKENLKPRKEHRPARTEKHNKYLENFIKNLK